MELTHLQKEQYKQKIKQSLGSQKEIRRIIVFGSFVHHNNPSDIDVAIFQDSGETYLDLAMKYRKLTRDISKEIPLDIIPLKNTTVVDSFLQEIEEGELIYEK